MTLVLNIHKILIPSFIHYCVFCDNKHHTFERLNANTKHLFLTDSMSDVPKPIYTKHMQTYATWATPSHIGTTQFLYEVLFKHCSLLPLEPYGGRE